jgi:hypothetical protein
LLTKADQNIQTYYTTSKRRFIHRSVGEPAEGSLTRIHVINQL